MWPTLQVLNEWKEFKSSAVQNLGQMPRFPNLSMIITPVSDEWMVEWIECKLLQTKLTAKIFKIIAFVPCGFWAGNKSISSNNLSGKVFLWEGEGGRYFQNIDDSQFVYYLKLRLCKL